MTGAAILRVDPEFHEHIPPLSDEELAALERNLVEDGCRDPLVVWGDLLIDGHNRYEICTRLGLPFATVQREFADREAALDWMEAHQLGRRNLSPDARRLLLGRRYNRMKLSQAAAGAIGGSSLGQNDLSLPEWTADRLAHEHGVSEATVRRAGKFADEVAAEPAFRAAIGAGVAVAQVRREMAPTPEPEPEPDADPETAKLRREIERLTRDGMVDEIIALRADLERALDKAKVLKAERDDLKVKFAEATQGDMGRALGMAQRRADAAGGRMNEYMMTAKRLEYRLKKSLERVAELENTPIDMGAL